MTSSSRLNLRKLNPRQREAVLHGDGPLLVLAGAGSGKTSTMSYRIAHLIADRHVPGSAILGLSFTRKAAQELKERVRKLVLETSGPSATKGITVTTFHSLCVRILREHAEALGYPRNFTILDQSDQVDIIREVLKTLKLDERRFDPDVIQFEISQAKNRFLAGDAARDYFLASKRVAEDYAIITANVYERYLEHLKALAAMDFDDLLFQAVSLLATNDTIRAATNEKYRHILVDEYQDTNPAQFKLIRLLTEKRQNICVVGDDDQSIYAWRGADPAHILEFSHHFPAAKTVTLDQNYRSTSTILDAANGVISKNTKRHPKKLWSDKGTGEPIQLTVVEEDRAEATLVAEEILRRAQVTVEGQTRQIRKWSDFAILYRSNPQSRLFEEALRMRTIPYKLVGALSFLDRREIKDTLSYWKLIVNEKDDASARRIVNWPTRGIGKGAIEAIGTHALQSGISFFEGLKAAEVVAPRATIGARQLREAILGLRDELIRTEIGPEALAAWARRSFERLGLKAALEADSDDPVQAGRKWENIEELANGFGQLPLAEILEQEREAGTPEGTGVEILREYLARLTLNALDEKEDKDDDQKERDQVTLLTLHGAKGLEYPVVFLVGLEEGFLPHRRTIEEAADFGEERRLCYVGITRAKEHLILTRAKNRIRYGKPVPRTPSRFLEEIPAELLVTRDESYSPDPNSQASQEAHEQRVSDFLSQIRAQLGAGQKPVRPR